MVGPSFAADEVADVIEAVLDTYRRQRIADKSAASNGVTRGAETFIDTLRRVGAEPFKLAANSVRTSTGKTAHAAETEVA